MKTEAQNPATAQGAHDLLQLISEHPFLRGMTAGHLQTLADSAMLRHFEKIEERLAAMQVRRRKETSK